MPGDEDAQDGADAPQTDASDGDVEASVPEPVDGAEKIDAEPLNNAVEHGVVTTETAIEENEDGDPVVTRTAAFAEVADRPKRKAIDDEHRKGKIEFYDDLRKFDPELAGTIRAQSQSAASGMSVTHPAIEGERSEMSETEKKITQACADLIDDLNLREEGVTFFTNAVTHGNDISHIEYEEGDEEDEGGVVDLTPLPLRLLTIVDEETAEGGFYSQSTDGFVTSEKEYENLITEADVYVMLEEIDDARDTWPADDILHIARNRRGNWYKDRLGRLTYNVWGETGLEPVKYAIQTKQNTLANKVAMDDKLLTREYYQINVEELFGHIEDPTLRQEKVEEYAAELRAKLENLEADQKPIIPEEVEVKVEGPSGETARNQAEFIQTMTDSIQHALTYHVASFGRDAGGTARGNRPAKEMSENSVRQLRDVVRTSFRKLFEIHAKLRFEEAREEGDPDSDTHTRYELADDIVLPTLKFDPVDPEDRNDEVRNAVTLYEKGIADLNEARSEANLEPIDEDDVEDRMWHPKKLPTTKEEEEQRREEENGPDDEGDGPPGGDGDGGDGPPERNLDEDEPESESRKPQTRPTDSDERDPYPSGAEDGGAE